MLAACRLLLVACCLSLQKTSYNSLHKRPAACDGPPGTIATNYVYSCISLRCISFLTKRRISSNASAILFKFSLSIIIPFYCILYHPIL